MLDGKTESVGAGLQSTPTEQACFRHMSRARVGIVAIALLTSAYCWLVVFTTPSYPGAIGVNYNTVGTDWMVFHGAAQSYFGGNLATIFDGNRFTDFLNKTYSAWLSAKLPFRPWVYPPNYLLLLLPFGLMNFITSYTIFQIVTAGGLVAAIVTGGGHDKHTAKIVAIGALCCPAASVNVVDGQNAFLTAALLVAGIRLLESHQLLAGILLGIASIKPQFAFLVPVALVAARQWRAMLGAAASASALIIVSAAIFGVEYWSIWLHQAVMAITSPNPKWIEYARMWGNSVWTCSVLMGMTPVMASVAQMASSLFATVAVAIAFYRSMNCYTKMAVFLAATILAAPHWSPYDAILLVLAGLYLLAQREDSRSVMWPWLLVLALWFVPLVSPPVIVQAGRVVPLIIAGFIFVALRIKWLPRHMFVFKYVGHE